jgi:ferric-dicitrate binding protein FerR (iron transport regulator)
MTPKEMIAERFETLAEAYGGDVATWPEAEREAAAQLMASDPARVRDVLARAEELDAALAAYSPHRAATGLMDRIVAGAPKRLLRRPFGWLVPAGMGAGLAAACAAGMVLGARLSTPPVQDPDAIVAAVGDEDVGAYFDEAA